jgi:23S rRNA (cytosine1962-C5)-methyltransferase
MTKLPEIIVPSNLKEKLIRGHPWIYRDRLSSAPHLDGGQWVKVKCGNWTGYGLWDNKGPIAIRIFSTRQLPDERWFKQRVKAAWELRASWRAQNCTAYRWLFGEGDGLPGITVDLYEDFAVIQTYMAGATVLLDWLVNALREIKPLKGILLRSQHNLEITEGKTQLIWGQTPPPDLKVKEDGLLFQVNLQTGQKTGLFLDHRENRRFLGTLTNNLTVLNCFAYTGAFSLYALQGGAKYVESLDIGKGLAEATELNIKLNGFDLQRHKFVTGDCFDVLNQYVREGKTFEAIVLDPPSFAKSKQNRFAALRAYTKINALALKCIASDGLLVTASCTSQVSPEDFKDMLASAALTSDRRLQIIHEAGQPSDHPVPVHFPEGRYLKFVVAKVRTNF